MKRRLALLLTLAMVFSLMSVMGVSAAGDVNVALGKPYTASTPYTNTTDNPNQYPLIDGKELTDGVKGTTNYGTEWHGFYWQDAYEVKVDLELKYPGIKKITMQFQHNTGASIYKPKSVEYFISNDNRNFTSVGTATPIQTGAIGGGLLYDYTLELTTTVTARFIKTIIMTDTGMFVFASEIEVFNSGEEGIDSEPGEVDPGPGEIIEPELDIRVINPKPETGMFVDGEYIYGVQPDTGYAYFMSMFINPVGLVLKDSDGNVKQTGPIATGDVLELTVDDELTDAKTIVIDGDLDGDGTLSSMDYLLYKRAYLGNYALTGAYLQAAYITESGSLDTIDYLRIKRQILGNYNIYMNKYAEAVIVYPMTFTKSSQGVYTMETKYHGEKLTLTFEKKTWGTWNIGTLTYAGNPLAGAGTDWEYVYRVGDKDHPIEFCGGNHGNEALVDLKFYDGTTGQEITLNVGETIEIECIKIVEKTQILFDQSTTAWCDVVRTYYIAGNRLELLVDYKLLRDCKFGLSYTCMFPVYRDYGTHSQFYNVNGTIANVNATPKDEYRQKYPSDFIGPYLGQLPATKVKLWGDKNPEYTFDVQVYDISASCGDFKNTEKTFLWDMSLGATKLYVSKFKTNDTVAAGTTWKTKSTWAFYIEPALPG